MSSTEYSCMVMLPVLLLCTVCVNIHMYIHTYTHIYTHTFYVIIFIVNVISVCFPEGSTEERTRFTFRLGKTRRYVTAISAIIIVCLILVLQWLGCKYIVII